MSICDVLNSTDCIFYFLMKEKDRTLVLNEEARDEVCKTFGDAIGAESYSVRIGPGVRSSDELKKEFANVIPAQINIILVDRESGIISLLSTDQRDRFFEIVMNAEDDVDTVMIAENVIAEIEGDAEFVHINAS